jgi:hypothetical protein
LGHLSFDCRGRLNANLELLIVIKMLERSAALGRNNGRPESKDLLLEAHDF